MITIFLALADEEVTENVIDKRNISRLFLVGISYIVLHFKIIKAHFATLI
ncbi:hypothetical protein ACFRAE_17090 [Sphingobacterium sp. HJSM2_6]